MEGSSFHLLLLKAPLDTVEGVQEITKQQESPMHIDDTSLVSKHFPQADQRSSAVLLNTAAATAIHEWAARHRAVYSPDVLPLDASQARVILQAAQKIEWPCSIFVADKTHDTWSGAILESQSVTDVSPGRALGYQYSTSNGRCIIKQATPPLQSNSVSNTASARFRPAQDVLSRLRHDPGINQADYQVVYEDRFAGEMILDLELWKTDVSDEEFIPMHRILKFRRKWDDVVIWDRNARVDFLFGDESAIPYVCGLVVEIHSAEEGRKLLETAPGFMEAVPCVIECASYSGTVKGYMFEPRE